MVMVSRRRTAGETDNEEALGAALDRLDAALMLLYGRHDEHNRSGVYAARMNLRRVCADYLAERMPAGKM